MSDKTDTSIEVGIDPVIEKRRRNADKVRLKRRYLSVNERKQKAKESREMQGSSMKKVGLFN